MTDRFVCVIYYRERNSNDVLQNGMDPFEIWNTLRYSAFDEKVVPTIVNRLIFNNENRKFVNYNRNTRRILLTNIGREWATSNCSKYSGTSG